MSDQKIFKYPGKDIDVFWDERLCIHIGECGQSAGNLFEGGRNPWCVPDNTTEAEVAEVCERCPSGALTYESRTTSAEKASAVNRINVTYNGPLYLSGDLAIEGASDEMDGVKYRAALCRCGKSKNKPFCDNSHLEHQFKDFGAIGDQGPGIQQSDGKLNVSMLKDGPLLIAGPCTMVSGSGRTAWRGEKVALCRCGASNNKPFCDGSHQKIGFKSG